MVVDGVGSCFFVASNGELARDLARSSGALCAAIQWFAQDGQKLRVGVRGSMAPRCVDYQLSG